MDSPSYPPNWIFCPFEEVIRVQGFSVSFVWLAFVQEDGESQPDALSVGVVLWQHRPPVLCQIF